MRFFILIFIILNSAISFAQQSTEEVSFLWKVHLTLYSHRQFSLSSISSSTSGQQTPQEHLYLSPQWVNVTVLEGNKVRFRLEFPVHVGLSSPYHQDGKVEVVFRNFVVQFSEYEMERILALQREPYFVFDQISEQNINSFAQSEKNTTIFDEQIRYFSKAIKVPQLHMFKGLRLYLPIEQMGSINGALGRVLVMSSLQGYLPWFKQGAPAELTERPLESVYRTFSLQDEIIRSYLGRLEWIHQRRNELSRRGWLESLLSQDGYTSSDKQNFNSRNNSSLVISGTRQCRDLL